jgi:hypothetical protein
MFNEALAYLLGLIGHRVRVYVTPADAHGEP